MNDLGSLGGHAAQVAAYATRQAKDTTVPYAALKAWWLERARQLGLDDRVLAAVCDRTARQQPAQDSIDVDELHRRLDAPDGITQHRASFDRRDVIRQICAEVQAGASVTDVLAHADGYVTSHHVVALVETTNDSIRRADGRSAPIHSNAPRWTTPDMFRVELHLIQMATGRPHSAAGVAQVEHVDSAIATSTLDDEQQLMVQRICRSGNGVDVVPGIAGSGKTHALAVARDAWTTSGRIVVGITLSAQAARQLEAGSGIPSMTIARFLRALDRPGTPDLGADHVLVVDEAAMVGTRTLVDLVSRVHKAAAKAVLVGDACQLPEIDAGGAFAGLARRSQATELTANRRQHAPWERQALADLRLGHTDEALAAYRAHGRIHDGGDPQRSRDDMVDRWLATVEEGRDALMLAPRHDAVRDLNAIARQRMVERGALRGESLRLGGLEYAVGDRVLGLANNYRAGILNGTRGTITAIDDCRRHLHVRARHGTVRVPFAYAEAGHLAHGYAVTIHKAQGATCDHALVLADETMSREAIYTAMSRGRHGNDVYLAIDAGRDEISHAPELTPDPLTAFAASIGRSAVQRMAIDAASPS